MNQFKNGSFFWQRFICLFKNLFFSFLFIGTSCKNLSKDSFTYDEFKTTLYYNNYTGGFSDLATLSMCINRWGTPEYIKAKGNVTQDGRHGAPHTIVYQWPKIFVDGKNVEIYFEIIKGSSADIIGRNIHTSIISSEMKKSLKVKEFRLIE